MTGGRFVVQHGRVIDVQGYLKLVESMPEPDPVLRDPWETGRMVDCVCKYLCGSSLRREDMRRVYSGHVWYGLNLCPGCLASEPGEYARIVCVRCRIVVGLAKPGRENGSGFVFEAGRAYHVERCNACAPTAGYAPVIEKLLYYRDAGLPVGVDEDAIREARELEIAGAPGGLLDRGGKNSLQGGGASIASFSQPIAL